MLVIGICAVNTKSVENQRMRHPPMDRSCQAQLLAEAADRPHKIPHETAKHTHALVGQPLASWFQFQPLWQGIYREQPDLFE